MSTARRTILSGAIIALALPVIARQDDADAGKRDDDPRDKPFLYMPISLRTVENVLERGTEEWARSFDFDNEQLDKMKQIVKDNFIPFLKKNRGTLGDLISEFTETQTGVDPPEVDDVADWAERTLPVFNRFKDMLDDTTEAIRPHMTEDQQFSLDSQHAAMEAGFTMVRRKLSGWADGGFDLETEWYPDHPRRDDSPQPTPVDLEAPQAKTDSDAPPTQPSPEEPADEWTKYVAAFIELYELGYDQQQNAWRQLRKHDTERDAYLTRPRTIRDVERIKRMMKEAESEQERTAARAGLERIDKHVETIFQHLKDALEKIPTREQRARADAKTPKPKDAERKKREGDAEEKKEDPGSP